MKTLLLLRHAKSSWADPARPDHDRPLNQRGKRDAPRMGRVLRDGQLVPDLIVSSTARRARKTAVAVADACGYERAVELRDELYGASAAECVAVLAELFGDPACVLLVGHNPGLEELVAAFAGSAHRFPTAALAWFDLAIDAWDELHLGAGAALRDLWRPKELD